MIRHAELCVGSQQEEIVLWNCLRTSLDQQWELSSTGLLKHS